MADAWRDALYAVGAATGWWFALRYDTTSLRWLTWLPAIGYSVTAALRVLLAVMGGGHG